MNRYIPYGLFLLAVCTGCGGKSLRPSEYKKFVENEANGYVQKTESGPYALRCIYTPPDYMAVNELRSDDIDGGAFRQLKKEYEKMDSYALSITSADPRALERFQPYFSFYMQENVRKVCDGDTSECTAYHAEPFNAIKGEQYIHIGFPAAGCPSQTETILLKDTPFLSENVGFSFHKKELLTPEIQLNE